MTASLRGMGSRLGVVLLCGAAGACTPVTETQRTGSVYSQQAFQGGAGASAAAPFGGAGTSASPAGSGYAGTTSFPNPSAGGAGISAGGAGVTGSAYPGGTAGVSGAAAGSPAPVPAGPPSSYTSMTFTVLTHPQLGQFAPANIGAIWIEDGSGKFVKTLEAWAFIREIYLTKFKAEAANNKVDAVTSATHGSHTVHTATWNLKDVNGNLVPDGPYKLIVECTDSDFTGQFVSIDFMKVGGAAPVMPPDSAAFSGMQLSFH